MNPTTPKRPGREVTVRTRHLLWRKTKVRSRRAGQSLRRKTRIRFRYLRWRLRTMRPSRSGLAFAAIGLAVVLTLPAFFVARELSPGPRAVVATYLDAVRNGDVDQALELSAWRPKGEPAKFLTAKALDDDWSFTAVTETGRAETRATVTARLTDTDDGNPVTAKFDLLASETGWSLRAPFASLRFGTRSLGFAETNGVAVESGPAGKQASYLFFPGRYEFYTDTAEQLGIDPVNTILAPGGLGSMKSRPGQLSKTGVFDLGEPVPSAAGLKAATKAMDDYIDNCADSTDLAPRACPFGSNQELERSLGYKYLDFEDISWTVKRYPKIKVAATDNGFAVTATKPGKMVFTATGVEQEYNDSTEEFDTVDEHKVKVSCGMDLTSMVVLLKPGGEWQAVHGVAETVSGDPATFSPAADVETCMR